jgi:hypothetical protein
VIPSVYFEYLRRKRPDQLPRIFAHNRHDILSLAALTGWVVDALARAPAVDLGGDELVGAGRLWDAVDGERAEACYRMALDRGVDSPLRERVLGRLAAIEKRRGRWDEARALWAAAIRGDAFDPRPWEEIAKLDEHRRRDLASARAIVDEALARARRERAGEGVLAALAHRLDRLTRRLGRAELRVAGAS